MCKCSKASKPFNVLIKPIGPVCNLRCQYCFYLGKKDRYPRTTSSYSMTSKTLDELIRQIIYSQPKSVHEIAFSWQGGEPTMMGIDFFKEVLSLQKKYAAKQYKIKISNNLQTNGTLIDDSWGAFLHDNRFLVGLSIDGPEKCHNKFRLDAKGEGTFSQVMRGLNTLIKHRVEFNTLTVINSFNKSYPIQIYKFLKQIGSRYMQFIPIVEYLGPEGKISAQKSFKTDKKYSLSPESVGPEQFGRFYISLFDHWKKRDIGRIFIQMFDVTLGSVLGFPSSLCIHDTTCGRSLVSEHNGDIYSCDHLVFDDFYLGNIFENSLTELLDSPKQVSFGQSKKELLPQLCHHCSYLNLCNGGCPVHRFYSTSRSKVGLKEHGVNALCKGYKKFYAHSLPDFKTMAKRIKAKQPPGPIC